MEANPLSIVCRAAGRAVHFTAADVPSFEALVEKFRGYYPELQANPLILNFEINVGQKCSLQCEADYANMVLLCNVLSRSVVYVGVPTITSHVPSPPPMYHDTTIPQFYRASTPNVTPPINPPEVAPPAKKTAKKSRKRGTPVPAFLFDDPEWPQFDREMGCMFPKRPTSKRQARQLREDRGDWFSGALTDIPSFDICPEEEPIVLRSALWVDYIKQVGQEFKGGMVEFRTKLIKFSSKVGFAFVYTKNDARYIRAECKQKEAEGCNWFVKGAVSTVTKALVMKDGNLRHTCRFNLISGDSKRMGQRLIGDFITDSIRATPILTATDLKRDILKHWGFDIEYDKVWRSVEVARANIFGTYHDSFDELRWYSDGILRTNPGSIVSLETEPVENRFKRFFVAFDASLKGFKHCRPMLFVDGTFMKTRYKGTLLSATAKDGNNGLFPVAIAIVDSENSDNWTWFINKLLEHVKHSEELLFVSDRAGGLLNAFGSIPSKPMHFYCLYHLMKNLRGMYPGKKYSESYKNLLCKLLKDAAYAPTNILYERAIALLVEKGGDKAAHFLVDLPPAKWAVAFAPDVHLYGELTSNAAESFNHWILDARSLPVTFMLDCIRMQLMRWFNERRGEINKATGAFTPNMEDKWNSMAAVGANWVLCPTNVHGIVEVISSTTTVVDLHAKKCTCYQWQITGFPCVHDIQVINKSWWDLPSVIDKAFFVSTYKLVYQANIYPIPKTEKYEFFDLNQPSKILPPIHRVVPGRPRKVRIRSKGESKQKRFLCGRCGKYGTHYWTTYAAALET